MIAFSKVSKQYGRQVLFVDASFQLNPNEKVGLVGPNGSGKTTLFRMIAGEEQPDDGDVSVPKKLTVGYFRQDVEEMSGRSVLDEAIAGSGRLGELHHELDPLRRSGRRDAEQLLDVDHAEAAQLHVMPRELGARADQNRFLPPPDFDGVVGDQPMPADDEIERAFALADAALADQQHAEAEDVHEHGVHHRALGERVLEHRRQLRDRHRRRHGGFQQRQAGTFRFGPFAIAHPAARVYEPGTNVLVTTWKTSTGWVVVRDALTIGPRDHEDTITPHTRPPADDDADHMFVRTVECIDGSVEIELICEPVFDYGRTAAEWKLVGDDRRFADASGAGQTVRLASDLALGIEANRVRARHVLEAGDRAYCALSWAEALAAPPEAENAAARSGLTTRYWRRWLGQARIPDHEWRDPLQRSALVIKGLTYMPTGATVASPARRAECRAAGR